MASYTQTAPTLLSVAGGGGPEWVDYDIFTDNGVPKGAVVEIIAANWVDNANVDMGVREDGSGFDRKVTLNEAEDGGLTCSRFLTTVDASTGLIELYRVFSYTIRYYLVGYWEDVTFTEAWDSFVVGSKEDGAWLEDSTFGGNLQASRVHLITITNDDAGKEYLGGVRNTSSALNRYVDIMEAEGGGVQSVSMYVKSDASSQIDVYAEESTDITFYNQGYFDSAIDFTEAFVSKGSAGAANTWYQSDLTGEGVADGRVVDCAPYNSQDASEQERGVRTNGTALARYIDLREAEGGGVSVYGMSVQTDSSAIVEGYSGANGISQFYYLGYFNVGTAGGTAYQEALSELAAAGANLTDTMRQHMPQINLSELGAAGIELTDTMRQHMPEFSLEETSVLSDTVENVSTLFREFEELAGNGLNLDQTLFQHMPTYNIKEIATLADTMTKDVALIRLLEEGADAVNLSDVIYQHMPVFALEEEVTLTDPVITAIKLFTKTLEELAASGINLTQFFYQNLPTYTISEEATLSDVLEKISVYNELIEQTITLVQFFYQHMPVFALEEIITLIDPSIVVDVVKVISNTITLTHYLFQMFPTYTISESVTLTDALLRDSDRVRDMFETITLVRHIYPHMPKYTISEAATLTDTYSFADKVFNRIFVEDDADGINLLGVDSKVWNISRELVENRALIDLIWQHAPTYTIRDNVNLTELDLIFDISKNLIENTILIRMVYAHLPVYTISESMVLTDSIVKDINRFLSETSTLTEFFLQNLPIYTVSENITLTDVLLRDSDRIRDMEETITLIQSFYQHMPVFGLEETLAIADSVFQHMPVFSLEEIISLVDTLEAIKLFQKSLEELAGAGINLTDSYEFLNIRIREFTEEAPLIDLIIKDVARTVLNTITLDDTRFSQTSYEIANVLSLVDSLTKFTTRTVENTLNLTSTLSTLSTWFLELTDEYSFSDTINILLNLYRTYTEEATLDDVVESLKVFISTLTDSITLDDTYIRDIAIPLLQGVTVADQMTRSTGELLSDGLTLVDVLSKYTIINRIETMVLSDEMLEVLAVYRQLTELINLSGIVIKDVNTTKTDSTTLTDLTLKGISKLVSDGIATLDILESSIYRNLLEYISGSDILIKDISTEMVETYTLADIILQMMPTFTLSEIITLSDIITPSTTGAIQRIFTENATLIETYLDTITLFRIISEGATLTDTPIKDILRTSSEGISTIDSIIKDITTSYEETSTLADSLELLRAIYRTYTETVTLNDVLTSLKVTIKTMQETTTLTDSIVDIYIVIRLLLETANLTDTLSTTSVLSLAEVLSETATLLDTMDMSIVKAVIQGITLSDSTIFATYKVLSDIAVLSEELTNVYTGFVLISELSTLTDVTYKGVNSLMTDTIALTDTLPKQVIQFRSFTETGILIDTLLRQVVLIREYTDSITLGDSNFTTSSKNLVESSTLVGSNIFGSAKNLTESHVLTGTIINSVSKMLLDVATLTDILTAISAQEYIELFTEALTLSDTYLKSIIKIFLETVEGFDTLPASWTYVISGSGSISVTSNRVRTGETSLEIYTDSPFEDAHMYTNFPARSYQKAKIWVNMDALTDSDRREYDLFSIRSGLTKMVGIGQTNVMGVNMWHFGWYDGYTLQQRIVTAVVPVADEWMSLELEFDRDNSTVTWYVNDIQINQKTGIDLEDYYASSLQIGFNGPSINKGYTVWFDDLTYDQIGSALILRDAMIRAFHKKIIVSKRFLELAGDRRIVIIPVKHRKV